MRACESAHDLHSEEMMLGASREIEGRLRRDVFGEMMLGARGAERAPAASLLRDGRACVRERELAREAHWPEMTQSARGAVRARAVSALPRTFARHRCALLDVSRKLQTRRAHVYARELQPIVASSSQSARADASS